MTAHTTINIKKSTKKRLDDFCDKNQKVRSGVLDVALNSHLDKVESK